MTLSDHENEPNEPNPEYDGSHESDNSDDVEHVLGLRRAARRTSQQYRSGDALRSAIARMFFSLLDLADDDTQRHFYR